LGSALEPIVFTGAYATGADLMLIRSPLYELEAARGARFAAWFGWEIAVSFGDPLEEYQSLRRNAGMLDLSFVGKIRIGGKDRVRFLHNMLSNNIQALDVGQGTLHGAVVSLPVATGG
jgi:glycine cleavage system aminomethyltransferase T